MREALRKILSKDGKIVIPKFCKFTEPELNYFRENCNFTDEELSYFNMKAKDKSNIEIALFLSVSESKISKIAKEVKSKMIRVI